mgnify:CR=1 FL=1
MSILVIGATFVDIKGFPFDNYLPTGRNAGRVEYVHGGVARNVVEDIANVELRPTFLGIVDDIYCLIADGRTRKVDMPKKKKIKHVQIICKQESMDGIDDLIIKRRLKLFDKETGRI